MKNIFLWDEKRTIKEDKKIDDLIYDATHYYDKELVSIADNESLIK
jgi:hypothetical protein